MSYEIAQERECGTVGSFSREGRRDKHIGAIEREYNEIRGVVFIRLSPGAIKTPEAVAGSVNINS